MKTIENLKVLETSDFERYAPSVLKQEPLGTVSKKYSFANTIEVVNDLEKLNWYPIEVKQNSIIKEAYRGYQKHMIKFRNPELQAINGLWPEIYLINSHDAKNSFQLMAGIYRLVCSNGMVVGDSVLPTMRIRHMNYDFSESSKAVGEIAKAFPWMLELIEKMKQITLDASQMETLTEKAFKLRWPDENPLNSDFISLSKVNRPTDYRNSLWNFFNILQENIIKGKWYKEKYDERNRRTYSKVRPVTAITQTVKINRDLWDLAQNYILN